ncbi:coenzyme F420-reducing hydrogenase beta subunit [Kineothrix alysoides]|uniref:Coenzyme F420-reducing hydrogenase beta subunit n=1 Tax=Kineothrix alysoides TaxID=1469948 RepID=A0A4R1QYT3_9FIRM|nr:Coenzyme F420 hydrogenase/dehydrogenase, beta subunit C-terminal domain [Kineothrix alysoides]TCL58126.1 coenzyme F420-reducing hydrogenase beta subunit [Kineothrix alysoides]
MIDKIEKSKCTGCKMCADICSQNAISFQTDQKGFWYPKVDMEKCIKCKLCIQKCPSLNQDDVRMMNRPSVYSAWSREGEVRHESTSGGIFYEIAKIFIEKGGVVCGARYGEKWKSAEHFLAYDLDGLKQLQGSKYFQSDTEGIYRAIKKEIQKGKEILFCGTPCQNAALSLYLGEDFPNIYYMDFICRSINSPLAFEKYVSELEELYGARAVKVHLKNKKNGWQSLASQICFANGMESLQDRHHDWWVRGFINYDLYTRESCYECLYRTLPRKAADITIGDFWGIEGESDYDMFQGISAVLLNSAKGVELFEHTKKYLYAKKKTIEDVLPGNVAIFENPRRTSKGDEFFELIKEYPFSKAVSLCIGVTKRSTHKNYFKIGKRILKELKEIKDLGQVSRVKYLYYNYLCKNIVRKGEAKLIPYKNAIIDLHPSARIYLHGDKNFEVGINKLKGSKAETYIRMNRDAVWNSYHGGALFYNATLEIKENAVFNSGFFTANGGSSIIADKKITFGEDVMLGRNVLVYDSDFHQLRNDDGEQINFASEVVIENHVWLTSNITILKGVTIGQDSLISAQTVVNKSVPPHSIIAGKANGTCVKDSVNWSRERCSKYKDLLDNSKIVLYGYGVLGKKFWEKHKEKIEYVVDNFSEKDGIYTFENFYKKYPELGENYIWVIAAPNYFSEIYWQIRKSYSEIMIIEAEL